MNDIQLVDNSQNSSSRSTFLQLGSMQRGRRKVVVENESETRHKGVKELMNQIPSNFHQRTQLSLEKKAAQISDEKRIFLEEFADVEQSIKENKERSNREVTRFRKRCFKMLKKYGNDRDFIFSWVKICPDILCNAEKFRGDREIILYAIQSNPSTLQYASRQLRGDKELVLTAIRKDCDALKYASFELLRDREFILTAINQPGYLPIHVLRQTIGNDKELLIQIASTNGLLALKLACPALLDDKDLMIAAMKNPEDSLLKEEFLHEHVLKKVKSNGMNLEWASPTMRNCLEIAKAAVEQNHEAIKFVSPELQKNEEILRIIKDKQKNLLQMGIQTKFTSEEEKNKKKIEFSQNRICEEVEFEEDISHVLKAANKKWKGLCELICNKILIDDLLGQADADANPGFFYEKITLDELNQPDVYKTHLMSVSSLSEKLGAYLNILPDNLFSVSEQLRLVKETKNFYEGGTRSYKTSCINRELLEMKLSTIEDNTTLKMFVFKKFPILYGHSLLIKKVAENHFIFFDPNRGETRGLSLEELSKQIDAQISAYGKNIYLTRGDDFLNKLIKKNVL